MEISTILQLRSWTSLTAIKTSIKLANWPGLSNSQETPPSATGGKKWIIDCFPEFWVEK